MKKSYIFGGVSALLLASAALYAAPGAGKMKMDANGDGAVTKTEAMAKADAHFTRMDANADGKLDEADKAAMLKKHFAEMDADKNGAINEAEFVAAHAARRAGREDHHEMGMSEGGPDGMKHGGRKGRRGGHGGGMKMLAMADSNGDKAVSQAEFRTAAEARFAKADTNSDGTISAEERKSLQKRMRGGRPPMPDMPAPDAG